MQSQTYPLMKILTGPHRGAEVVLAPGEHDVGTHEDCDIVLSDQSLAPRHARLLVEASTLRIMALDGAVTVDGIAVGTEALDLALFATVNIGTTEFRIGLQGAHWQQMALTSTAEPSATEKPKPAAPDVPHEVQTPDGIVDSVSHAARTMARISGMAPVAWRGRSFYSSTWIVGIAFLVVSVVVALDRFQVGAGINVGNSVLHAGTTGPSELAISGVAPALLKSEVERAMAPLDMPQLELLESGANELTVLGFVADKADARRVDEALQPFGRAVKKRVFAQVEVVSRANAILRELKLVGLQAKDDGPGRVTISGYVETTSAWQRAHATLMRDNPGLRDVDGSKIQTRSERAGLLRDWLNDDGLDLDVVPRPSGLEVTGRVDAHASEALQGTLRRFREEFGDRPSVKANVKLTSQRSKPSTLAISAIVVNGAERYVLTKNGDRYRQGEKLPDGYVVEQIEARRVVVSKNGRSDVRYLGARTTPASEDNAAGPSPEADQEVKS